MDPRHPSYDAEYRREFQAEAVRMHTENTRRRQAAVDYRNKEVRRLTTEARVPYPGDIVPAIVPLNADDLYEDDVMRDDVDDADVGPRLGDGDGDAEVRVTQSLQIFKARLVFEVLDIT